MDHLSGTDASFLHLETPETPMHVGSLMLFELPKGYTGDYYEDVKALIGKRMHLCGLFNRKLAQMPFELAEPVWIEDDDVDLDYHVRSLTLRRPGTLAQLEVLTARLHSSLLDRSRPLWEVYIIDGLEDGRIAYYTKAHHADGSGADGQVLRPTQVREVPLPGRRANKLLLTGCAELLRRRCRTPLGSTSAGAGAQAAGRWRGRKIIAARCGGQRGFNLGRKTIQRRDHEPAPSAPVAAATTSRRSASASAAPSTPW
jgi:WS/DGAT/MGAT family acyltransferase